MQQQQVRASLNGPGRTRTFGNAARSIPAWPAWAASATASATASGSRSRATTAITATARTAATSFPASVGGREQKYGGMVNALFDLDIGSPYVFPYIGGGAGYEQRRGATCAASVGSTRTRPRRIRPRASFAYQAHRRVVVPDSAGRRPVAHGRVPLLRPRRATATTASPCPPALRAGLRLRDAEADYNHSLMLGLRYAFNVAPPARAGRRPPAAAGAAAARTYLVFFDWDRADLTDRARADRRRGGAGDDPRSRSPASR